MISALLIGRKGSIGFPGKNTYPVFGKPLAYYPMAAAKEAHLVDRVYLSTDCDVLKDLARQENIEIIERPEHLCTKEALGEDVFVHGFREIVKKNGPQELLVLLMCNAATIRADAIDEGINVLKENPSYDSAISVSKYNMWSPLRARRIDKEGLLKPFIPFEAISNPKTLNCDRDSQGDVYFADMGVSIVRPRCLENLDQGLLPQKWMGQRIYPLIQEGGCDVDYEFQIAQTEFWLKKYGYHDQKRNIDKTVVSPPLAPPLAGQVGGVRGGDIEKRIDPKC